MKKIFSTLVFNLLIVVVGLANDGAFYFNGNHLIPMIENDVSVKKEILNIKRKDDSRVEINVYYEFFNPTKEKTIHVGFEAECPKGDLRMVNTKNSLGHPYMYDFSVLSNDSFLKYDVAIVDNDVYYKNGLIESKSKEWLKSNLEEHYSYKYVYHFKTKFKKGLNILKHSYIIELGSSFIDLFQLEYVLTAAKRWGNKQIDDFTLNIDMGNFQELIMPKSFFESKDEWKINGVGKIIDSFETYHDMNPKPLMFIIRNGSLIFHSTNFKPKKELNISCQIYRFGLVNFDGKIKEELPFSIEKIGDIIDKKLLPFSTQILRNLPFARRGYVFTNPELKAFYEKQYWYMPNVNYVPSISNLTKEERDWLNKLELESRTNN